MMKPHLEFSGDSNTEKKMPLAPAVLFIYSVRSEMISVLSSKRSQKRNEWENRVKNEGVSNCVGSRQVARWGAEVRGCCHDNNFSLWLFLAKKKKPTREK